MKISRLAIAFTLLLAVGACQKSNDVTGTEVTNAEAATLVGSSLAINSNGFVNLSTTDITVQAQVMIDLGLACGATKTYNLTRQSPSGLATTYSYALNYSYTLNCNGNNLPDNITGSLTNTGNFDNATLSSTNLGSATFRVAGLTAGVTGYVINGEYKVAGTFQSKVGDKHYTNSNVDVNVVNLIINKATKQVTSGSATITVNGSTTAHSFAFTGTLTFNGNGTASLTLNGSNYLIDITTGIATKV